MGRSTHLDIALLSSSLVVWIETLIRQKEQWVKEGYGQPCCRISFPEALPASILPRMKSSFILRLPFNRQYYEMLYNTADELLNLVVDQGVKYTELEYIHALTLLHRSQTGVGDQTTQNMRLQRLKEIICEQAAIKQATKDKKITTV
ncbi:hypothetical protein CB1_002312004 [Camelus ferus]|nr:hypothetical protein CB1_002312004 [Camelus ferus]